jgi:hypothetical protein
MQVIVRKQAYCQIRDVKWLVKNKIVIKFWGGWEEWILN